MATGFNVMDALNKNSKAGVDESPKARFRTKDISIHKMYRNEMNFYKISDIEELAGDILLYGLKQNLELVYEPCDAGEYRIIAGERRWEALKYLVEKGYQEFEIATCKLTTPQDADEEQAEIIVANAYRTKTVADMVEEERRLKTSLENMRAAGKKIKGYDLSTGRLRDVIASMLNVSKTKVAQIESVNNHLIPEFKEELRGERLSFSAAYELAGMSEDQQQEVYGKYQQDGELSHKEIRDIKNGKAPENVSDSDTREPGQSIMPEPVEAAVESAAAAGGEYETPHPEGITSLCYSCTEYEACNVKTGTCTKCDRYRNRKEAYKTDEQRYNEEQAAIDREVQRKLKEKEEHEETPRVQQDGERKTVRVTEKKFEEIAVRHTRPYIVLKDENFKVGECIRLAEYKNGEETGRYAEKLIICKDDSGTIGALEKPMCIIGVMNYRN